MHARFAHNAADFEVVSMSTVGSEGKPRFFVYIVESPSAIDLYHRKSEAELLVHSLTLGGTPCVARTAATKEAFLAALLVGLREEMEQRPSLTPILHISAHGDDQGIQFTDSQVMSWSELKQWLQRINQALSGRLVLGISACEGFTACQMAMDQKDEPPFFALISHAKKPTWSDAAVGFLSFYHRMAKGTHVSEALKAMQMASGDDGFRYILGSAAKEAYLKALKTVDLEYARTTLQQEADRTGVSADAKAPELTRPLELSELG